ncbi:MAG: helix-turn-helix domain-containing protein [Cyclobacteriaceae bacterium]
MPVKHVLNNHLPTLKAIGEKLKTLRNNNSLGIAEFSSAIGLSRNTYAMMEAGKIYFNINTLLIILDYYSISMRDFFQELEK